MDKKSTIRLTESELKQIISESVKQILKEGKYVNNRKPFEGGYFYDDDNLTYVEKDPWYDATQTPEAKQKHKERVDRMWANKQRRLWYDYIWKDKNEVLNLLKNNYDSLIQEVEEDIWALQWQYAPEGRRISVHGDFEAWELISGGYALIVRVGMEKKYAEDDE